MSGSRVTERPGTRCLALLLALLAAVMLGCVMATAATTAHSEHDSQLVHVMPSQATDCESCATMGDDLPSVQHQSPPLPTIWQLPVLPAELYRPAARPLERTPCQAPRALWLSPTFLCISRT